MSRYKALRHVGCGVVTAATISALNYIRGAPAGLIFFMHIVIEYEP